MIHLHHVEGAVARANPADSAFGRRDAPYIANVIAVWPEPALQERQIANVRATAETLRAVSPGGAYLNFFDADEGDTRIRAAYGPDNYDRLAALKAAYDPDNIFHLNQNIPPATN